MMDTRNDLAVNLGAESGRTIISSLEDRRLSLTGYTHPFPNGPVRSPGGLHWDVLRLWSEIKAGIGTSSAKFKEAG